MPLKVALEKTQGRDSTCQLGDLDFVEIKVTDETYCHLLGFLFTEYCYFMKSVFVTLKGQIYERTDTILCKSYCNKSLIYFTFVWSHF